MYSPMYASTTSSGDEYASTASTPTFMDISHSIWMNPMSLQEKCLDYASSVEYYPTLPSQPQAVIYADDQQRDCSPSMLTCIPSEFLPLSPPQYPHYCHLPHQPARSSSMEIDYNHHEPDVSLTQDIGNVAAAALTPFMTMSRTTTTTTPAAVVAAGSSLGEGLTTTIVHVPTDIRPYTCCACPRAFARKHDLQRHIRVHTGDKPYACLSCKKAFARTDALKRHLRMEDQCRLSPEVQAMKHAGKRRYRNL